MNKRDFLKVAGLASAGSLLSTDVIQNIANANQVTNPNCVLIPSETAGPFPLDLSANNFYFRQDIREDQVGVKLNLKLRIIGFDNCLPMQNLRVNIWHCNKDGLYSGYDNNMNAGQAGKTFNRGYQLTDLNGEVNFITNFPGWYNGRVCHIHFQVYVSSVYSAVSQLTFPVDAKNKLYTDNPTFYMKGPDATLPSQDGIFSDGYNFQISTLTVNSDGSYNGTLEVTVKGAGKSTAGLANHEPETGGYFKLEQNVPNPFSNETAIPFDLINSGEVSLQLWDLSGKILTEINKGVLNAGKHSIKIDFGLLGLPITNYVYQLKIKNKDGVFTQCKMMTISK